LRRLPKIPDRLVPSLRTERVTSEGLDLIARMLG
jgi:hypothetical protein